MTTLQEQSPRMFRTYYKKANILAQEIGTIWQSLVDEKTGPINIDIGGGGDPFVIPEIDGLDLPPIDWQFPEITNITNINITDERDDDDDDGVPDEDDADEREYLVTKTETTYAWFRSVVPGKVLGPSNTGPNADTSIFRARGQYCIESRPSDGPTNSRPNCHPNSCR